MAITNASEQGVLVEQVHADSAIVHLGGVFEAGFVAEEGVLLFLSIIVPSGAVPSLLEVGGVPILDAALGGVYPLAQLLESRRKPFGVVACRALVLAVGGQDGAEFLVLLLAVSLVAALCEVEGGAVDAGGLPQGLACKAPSTLPRRVDDRVLAGVQG